MSQTLSQLARCNIAMSSPWSELSCIVSFRPLPLWLCSTRVAVLWDWWDGSIDQWAAVFLANQYIFRAGLKIGTPRQVFLRSPDGILVATKEIMRNKPRKHKWTPYSFEHSLFLYPPIYMVLLYPPKCSRWIPKCFFTKAHPFVNVP